jgi:archaellum biogenesis ATPase FlaH
MTELTRLTYGALRQKLLSKSVTVKETIGAYIHQMAQTRS